MSNRTEPSDASKPKVESKRTYAIAAVVIGFFVIGLLAMLLTGYLSGGQPRTAPAPTSSASTPGQVLQA